MDERDASSNWKEADRARPTNFSESPGVRKSVQCAFVLGSDVIKKEKRGRVESQSLYFTPYIQCGVLSCLRLPSNRGMHH